jgi:hypothetical protein
MKGSEKPFLKMICTVFISAAYGSDSKDTCLDQAGVFATFLSTVEQASTMKPS